ncbi:MAG TPA: O-antigen ligase family protein [Thiolinea sp.]|nr:O-antigen ligase family protein [Thiolinea sp.]
MRKLSLLLLLLFIFSSVWNDMVVLGSFGTLSRLFGVLAFGVGILTLLLERQFRPLPEIYLIICLFVLWTWLSFFWTVWPEETRKMAFSLLQLALLSMLMWQFLPRRLELQHAFLAIVAGGYVLIFFTVQTWLAGQQAYADRYSAPGVNGNELASSLGLAVPLALYLIHASRYLPVRLLAVIYVPAAFFAISLSASRSGFLLAVLGLAYLPVLFYRLSGFWRLAFALAGGAAVIGLLALIPPESISRLSTIGRELSSGTMTGRTTIWHFGLEAWMQQPLLGYGFGSYFKVVTPFSVNYTAHNSFISVLVETGIIGLLLFLLFFLYLFYYLRFVPRQEFMLQLTLLMLLIVSQMAVEWSAEKIAWIFYSLLIVNVWVDRPESRPVPLILKPEGQLGNATQA